ncbi:hypothetical protein C5S35_05015 [Candidatus Methanophagaceae archaeon]|nr:hypothetical protein C5S35_05015 [Methanophagales archaeon]
MINRISNRLKGLSGPDQPFKQTLKSSIITFRNSSLMNLLIENNLNTAGTYQWTSLLN